MAATTIATEDRARFVDLFERGINYFNTCIAGCSREVGNLEYPLAVYLARHEKLAETIHSDAPITPDSFDIEALELLGRIVEFGAEAFDFEVHTNPYMAARLDAPLADEFELNNRLVKQAEAIAYGR